MAKNQKFDVIFGQKPEIWRHFWPYYKLYAVMTAVNYSDGRRNGLNGLQFYIVFIVYTVNYFLTLQIYTFYSNTIAATFAHFKFIYLSNI